MNEFSKLLQKDIFITRIFIEMILVEMILIEMILVGVILVGVALVGVVFVGVVLMQDCLSVRGVYFLQLQKMVILNPIIENLKKIVKLSINCSENNE